VLERDNITSLIKERLLGQGIRLCNVMAIRIIVMAYIHDDTIVKPKLENSRFGPVMSLDKMRKLT